MPTCGDAEDLGEEAAEDLLVAGCAARAARSGRAGVSGAGSASRSSLPFGGERQLVAATTNAAGTMYSGSGPAQRRTRRP